MNIITEWIETQFVMSNDFFWECISLEMKDTAVLQWMSEIRGFSLTAVMGGWQAGKLAGRQAGGISQSG